MPEFVGAQSEDDFFNSVRKNSNDRKMGRRMEPITTVSFESLSALLAVVTPQRARLVETLKEKGYFESITTLADALQRDRGTVSKDVKSYLMLVLFALKYEHFRDMANAPRFFQQQIKFDWN